MTGILKEAWHATICQDSLAADGLPLPHTLDTPQPPTQDPTAIGRHRGALGPGRTTQYPTLYLSGIRGRVRGDLSADRVNQLDARRDHWPPPLCCTPVRPSGGDRDPRPVYRPNGPTPDSSLDQPNLRYHRPMDTTGFALLPPQQPDSALSDTRDPPTRQDLCYYAIPMRCYRMVRVDEAAAPRLVAEPIGQDAVEAAERKRAQEGPAAKRRRLLESQDQTATESIPITSEPEAAAPRQTKKKKKKKRAPRKRRRNGERTGPGGGIGNRRRELEVELAHLPASKACVGRLLQWQTGGGSLDGGPREVASGTSVNGMALSEVTDPSGQGVVRRMVYGVPVITLIELGLVPESPTPVIDRLCEQLGMPLLGTRNTAKRKLRRRPLPSSSSSMGSSLAHGQWPDGLSKETLATLLFPPLDPTHWRNRVRFEAASVGVGLQGTGNRLSSDRFERLIAEAQKVLLTDTEASEWRNSQAYAMIEAAHQAGPCYGPELKRVLLAMDMQRTRRPPRRGFHARGWRHRIVPVFMLPFLLTQPALYHPYETSSDPWYACLNLAHGLRLLSNAGDSLDNTERASAWHDERLMTLTISMAWKRGSHQGQLALGFLNELMGMRRDNERLGAMVRRLSLKVSQLEDAVFSDDDDEDKDMSDTEQVLSGSAGESTLDLNSLEP